MNMYVVLGGMGGRTENVCVVCSPWEGVGESLGWGSPGLGGTHPVPGTGWKTSVSTACFYTCGITMEAMCSAQRKTTALKSQWLSVLYLYDTGSKISPEVFFRVWPCSRSNTLMNGISKAVVWTLIMCCYRWWAFGFRNKTNRKDVIDWFRLWSSCLDSCYSFCFHSASWVLCR